MKFEELIVLLPCHSLDDFPVHHEGAAAEGLLAAWSALWHPALLAMTQKTPLWRRADDPPEKTAGKLFLIPVVSESMLSEGWADKAVSESAFLVRGAYTRNDMVEAILAEVGNPQGFSEAIAADFHAVGLCYLLVDLLTRLMRHTSHIDEPRLETAAVAAAVAAMAGNDDEARAQLRACVDVLTEARERYYPVEAFLIDLTLTADSIIGESLRKDLAKGGAQSLLLTGELLTQIAEREPETLARLASAIQSNATCVVGGEWSEIETPLLPPETVLENFHRGRAAFQKHLSRAPVVYARRRYGLSPILPCLLKSFGYRGAVHFTLDDGSFPKSEQSKGIWEGFTHDTIDSIHRLPLDAAKAESFLSMPQKLGESMDYDYVATLTFARWPGAESIFFDDLRRIAHYGNPLGRFVTLDDYFDRVAGQGGSNRFRADLYRAPYLRQAIDAHAPDPVSHFMNAQRAAAANSARETAATLAALATGESSNASADLDASLRRAFGAPEADQNAGTLLVNPLNFTRKIPHPQHPEALPPVELAGMGFAWTANGPAPAPASKPRLFRGGGANIAGKDSLRNEFMEVTISSRTGGISGLYDKSRPQNRLSQQIAFRLPAKPVKPGDVYRDPDETAEYAVGVCEELKIAESGPHQGTIVTRGYVPGPKGTRRAEFEQRFTLSSASRVVDIEIHLTTEEKTVGDPWNNYFASRFAWADSNADLVASSFFGRHTTSAKRIEAPQFVEIRDARAKTTLLTDGLPYHRKVGFRMLDTILLAGNELERRFRLGVGVELAHPAQDALAFLSPVIAVPAGKPASGESGWLLHCDAKNALVSQLTPVISDGRVRGFGARLLETEGKHGNVKLRAFRKLARANLVDFAGNAGETLAIEEDSVTLPLGAFEWREIEAMIWQ